MREMFVSCAKLMLCFGALVRSFVLGKNFDVNSSKCLASSLYDILKYSLKCYIIGFEGEN